MNTVKNKGFFSNKIIQRFLSIFLLLVSLSISFLAGNYSDASQTEVCAEFFTALTKNHTSSGIYSALIVEEKENSEKHLLGTESEFYRLYGSFRQDKACFASTYNLCKEFDVLLDGTDVNNLSLLYTSSGLMLKEDGYGRWRHEFYPIYMMFDAPKKDRPSTPGGYCFISQSQADSLIRSNYLGYIPPEPFTMGDYKELQYKIISLSNKDSSYKYRILSVFYEKGSYFNALNEIMGDFMFIFGGTPSHLQKQATYFMRDYTFQNEYYINYVQEKYGENDFTYKIGTYNVIDDFADKINISESIFGKKNNVISSLIFSLSIILATILLVYAFLVGFGEHWVDIILFYTFAFAPFFVFKYLAYYTESSKWFTAVSTQFNMWLLVFLCCVFPIIIVLSKLYRKRKQNAQSYS